MPAPATHSAIGPFARINEIMSLMTDDISLDRARQLEAEHTALLRVIESKRNEMATIGRWAGIGHDDIEEALRNDMPIEEFRAQAFARKSDEAGQIRTSAVHGRVEFGRDANETLTKSIEDTLVARMTGKAPEGAAREFMGRSLLELGSTLLQARGERVSWSNRDQLVERIMARGMHTTSDFPTLLSAAGNRVLAEAYTVAQSPLKALARKRTRVDFRDVTGVNLSEPPRLLRVNEAGAVTHGTRAEETRPLYKIEEFARIFSITRRAIINDDLNAFGDALSAFGRGAAHTEADILADLFLANSGNGVTLWDGKSLYHSDHANKAPSGSLLSVDALGRSRQAMREQTDIDGKTKINVTPRHLVVGPELEMKAEQILTAIAAAQVDDVNPFSNKLTLHVEPRFSGTAWRLFADPAQMPCIEYAYLDGQEGPQLAMKEGWTTLGQEFRAVLDFGAGIVEYRGTFMDAGA